MNVKDALLKLGEEADELYLPNQVRELSSSPSPLTFLREYVMPNIPVVIKGGVEHWAALTKWTDDYMQQKLGTNKVTVALTPNGYADAPVGNRFVMPHEEQVTFTQFLNMLEASNTTTTEVAYLQNQNSSFTQQFNALMADAEGEIDWASEAFGKQPDAVNFWMGGRHSVTSMHKDHYENMYAVVRGSKTFTLLPPTDHACLHFDEYIPARYVKSPDGYVIKDERNEPCCHFCQQLRNENVDEKILNSPDNKNDNDLQNGNHCNSDEDSANCKINKNETTTEICECACHTSPLVPWITTDPLDPDERFTKHAHPLTVTLHAGDLLYLPSLWYHHVQQGDNTVAVNFWYDMEYDIKYNYLKFVEQVNRIAIHNNEDG